MPLVHSTLTEDESVLLAALEPSSTDRILALFASGCGDAGLALLAAGAGHVAVNDRFDHPGLVAQLRFKMALVRALDPLEVRRFLGLEDGMDPATRQGHLDDLLGDLDPEVRDFWQPLRSTVTQGMVRHDVMRRFGRLLARAARVRDALASWPRLLDGLARLVLLGSPLFYPRAERDHSLGYRQLRADPIPSFDALLNAAGRAPDGDFVRSDRMDYLSESGLTRLRGRLDDLSIVDDLEGDWTRVYLSNLIDYLPGEAFRDLVLRTAGGRAVRFFVNSTRRGADLHPVLIPLVEAGSVVVREERTVALRQQDELGVYPGLVVFETRGA